MKEKNIGLFGYEHKVGSDLTSNVNKVGEAIDVLFI